MIGGARRGGDRPPHGRGKTPPDINHLHSIMVFNISYKTRKEELYRSFDSFGDIADVYIPRDKYGESRGFGFVRFYDRRDAEDAKSMDGQVIGGRRIGVQMAKYGRRHEQGGYNRDRGGGYGRPRSIDYRGGGRGPGGPPAMDYGRGGRDRAPHRGHGRRRSYSRSRSRSRGRDYHSRSRSRSRSRSGHYRRRYYSRSRSGSRSRHKDSKRDDSYRKRSFSRSRSRSPSHDRHRKGSDPVATNVATTTTTTTTAAVAPPKVDTYAAPVDSGIKEAVVGHGGHLQPQVAAPPPVQPVAPVTTQM